MFDNFGDTEIVLFSNIKWGHFPSKQLLMCGTNDTL